MSKRTVIFLSGYLVPNWLAKSPLVWNQARWQDYRTIFIKSPVPTSDAMVQAHLNQLAYLTSLFPNVAVVGQSLGAWWAANLACEPAAQMKRVAFWTPLVDANAYPIFKVSRNHHPLNKKPNPSIVGPGSSLVLYGDKDFVVPQWTHAQNLVSHFQALTYKLDGGHWFQANHNRGIDYLLDWIVAV
jgi:hypothetical protein